MEYKSKEKSTQSGMKTILQKTVITVGLLSLSSTAAHAVTNADYKSLPTFNSTSVPPNVLFIIDNSNSMDEDVTGAAVGGDSPLSRSEIARKAIIKIIEDQKENMRFGLMAYRQEGVYQKYIHNSFYYCSYDPDTYDPGGTPTPTDPTSNTRSFPNPTDPGHFIYYDVALPFYTTNLSNTFCYSYNYSADGTSSNDDYWCYKQKTGEGPTPEKVKPRTKLQNLYGYSSFYYSSSFIPTDSDYAAGILEFGYEQASVPIGKTWFAENSPGDGILHVNIKDSDTPHIDALKAKLGTSQFDTATDTPLRNAGLTPLGGTLQTAQEYFQGSSVNTASGVASTNPITERCQQNYVILLTDGLPSVDSNGNPGDTDSLLQKVKDSITALRNTNNIDFVDNKFDVKTYVVGFALPPTLGSKLDELAVAGGTDINGKALLANDAVELGQKLELLMHDISKKAASGSSASVISNSRSGEGVTYSSVFYPEYTVGDNTVKWVGDLNSLFVDSYGNLREDTNNNKQLDKDTDCIIRYIHKSHGVVAQRYIDSNQNNTLDLDEDLNGNGVLDLHLNEDLNGNGILDGGEDLNGNNLLDYEISEDRNGNGFLDQDEDANDNNELDPGEDNGDGVLYTEDKFVDEVSLTDLNYIWSASEWLNELNPSYIHHNRPGYDNLNWKKRYIFTFIDSDNDQVVDAYEQIPFTDDRVSALRLHLLVYPTLSDEPDWLAKIRADGNYGHFLEHQSARIINFIRGKDQGEVTYATDKPYTLEAMRSRKVDYDGDGITETWMLGDIIHSSPLAVGAPSESYHLLYEDDSYANFAEKYINRRTVVYVGGNDGMIHAFNAGFFDPRNLKLNDTTVHVAEPYVDTNNNHQWDNGEPYTDRNYNGIYDDGLGDETKFELGSELWAYVPHNLLPHLRFLTSPDYEHVYYNDLPPRVFDVKIFEQETACTTEGLYSKNCIHPNGWGTILVTGMRLGGGLYERFKTWDFPMTYAPTATGTWTISPDADLESTCDETGCTIKSKNNAKPIVEIKNSLAGIDADRIKSIKIQFKKNSSDDIAANGVTFHWDGGTINKPAPDFDEDESSKYYSYTFDMSSKSTWKDTINTIWFTINNPLPDADSIILDYIDLEDSEGYSSSYSIIDITNPEKEPKVLAELKPRGLGFTTNEPVVIPIKSKVDNTINDWYLAFGSGPNHNNRADSIALNKVTSNTPGKIYIVSLNELAKGKLKMLNDAGLPVNGERSFATLDSNTIISDMVPLDFDLDYDVDVVYFGTVSGNSFDGWGGKMRRLVLDEGNPDTKTWQGDKVLFKLDPGQTITAKPTVGSDNLNNLWVYFGTGKYFVEQDEANTDLQAFYGIKEPLGLTGRTWDEVEKEELINTTDAKVFDNKRVTGIPALDSGTTINNWSELIATIDSMSGWMRDLEEAGERSLGQAALLGQTLTFATYIPSTDICVTDGRSIGNALYYKTGTAYFNSVIGYIFEDLDGDDTMEEGEKRMLTRFNIGRGLTYSPAVHIGGDEGSSVIFSTSDGSVRSFEQNNPGLTKSKRASWENVTQ